MATQNPLLPPGTYVQYNATLQNPRSPAPSSDEQGVGIIKQSFTRSDGPYYQVVWNPGNMKPKSALYHGDQLCAITQQVASQIAASGQPADTGTPGSNFTQPNIPTQGLPPSVQGSGSFSAGAPDQSNPTLMETS